MAFDATNGDTHSQLPLVGIALSALQVYQMFPSGHVVQSGGHSKQLEVSLGSA